MQCIVATLFLAVFCQQATADLDASSPVVKVVKLLKDLKATLKKDGDDESKAFNKYTEWCRKSSNGLGREIKGEKSQIEGQKAVIQKTRSDIQTASLKIDSEAGSVSENDKTLSQATKIRKKEREEFMASQQELVDSVDTLQRASGVLQKKVKGTAFVETANVKSLIATVGEVINAASLDLHDQKKLMALVQDSEDSEDGTDELGAPTVAAYKVHSSSILDLLEDLKDKAQQQLSQLRKEEQHAQNAFEMLKQSLVDQIEIANKQLAAAKEAKHVGRQAKATSKGDLAVTDKELDTDKGALANMKGGCFQVASEFDASVKSRAEEMSAIDAALEALTSGFKAPSFLQTQSVEHNDGFEVVNILRKLAQHDRSSGLTQLAARVGAVMSSRRHEADPFGKVKGMISSMIKRLKKEAGEEASHKAYCEKELTQSKDKKEDLKASIDKFSAQMEKVKTKAADMKDTVTSLQKDLLELSEEQGEATALRRKQKANFKVTQADLKQGLEAVRMAMTMLRKYYEEPKKDAFIQKPQWSHSANMGTGKTVISILEMVDENLGKQLSICNTEEAEFAHAYKKLSEDNAETKLVKEHTVKYKMKEETWGTKALNELRSDLDGANTEMEAIKEYAENLRRMCAAKGDESYAEKKARRDSEIAGMKEALKVIENETLLQIQPQHSALRGVAVVKH